MCEQRRCLGTANTIGDLKSLLDGAIYVAGKDAYWDADENGNIYIYSEHEDTIFRIKQLRTDAQALLQQDGGRRCGYMTFDEWWEEAITRHGVQTWTRDERIAKLFAKTAWLDGFVAGTKKKSEPFKGEVDEDDTEAGSEAT